MRPGTTNTPICHYPKCRRASGSAVGPPARAGGPAPALASEVYGWLATGVEPGASAGSSFWLSAQPDAQALAAGAMASLEANLAPNPLAACWAQFPAAPAAAAAAGKPFEGTASPLVSVAGGPLVLYGGRPDAARDFPLPDLGTGRPPWLDSPGPDPVVLDPLPPPRRLDGAGRDAARRRPRIAGRRPAARAGLAAP